jgi:hypothetical protein
MEPTNAAMRKNLLVVPTLGGAEDKGDGVAGELQSPFIR